MANPASAVYHELVTLVAKTFGIGDVPREALSTLAQRIDVAFVYGSVARAEQRATSDVDVLIVGDILLSDLDPYSVERKPSSAAKCRRRSSIARHLRDASMNRITSSSRSSPGRKSSLSGIPPS